MSELPRTQRSRLILNLIASFVQASGSHRIEDRFLRKTWDFGKGGQTLPADNHAWPFEWALPGATPESIEGLPKSWNIYRLKATIERGIMQQNVVARKHVRIIRTLDPSDLELSLGMVGLANHPEKPNADLKSL